MPGRDGDRVRLLLVEDDAQEERRIRRMLGRVSTPVFDLTVSASPEDGAQRLASGRCDVLLLDLSMAGDSLDRF